VEGQLNEIRPDLSIHWNGTVTKATYLSLTISRSVGGVSKCKMCFRFLLVGVDMIPLVFFFTLAGG